MNKQSTDEIRYLTAEETEGATGGSLAYAIWRRNQVLQQKIELEIESVEVKTLHKA